MPFVSIIVPVYNVEPYIRECVDSIIGQTCADWELILVDDGSPDGCPMICDEYAAMDGRIKVIHQKNAGVAVARNTGLDVAQGEWIWFVDSDDVVDMSHVDDAAEWLREHPEIDLVMFDLETFKDGEAVPARHGKFVVADTHLSKNDFLMKHICYHHPRLWYHRRGMAGIPHSHPLDRHPRPRSTDFGNIGQLTSGTSVPRNTGAGTGGTPDTCLPPVRFTRGMKTGEDGEFQYKYLMRCKKPARVFSTIYYYRQREGSATNMSDSRLQVVKDTVQVYRNLLAFMQEEHVKLEPWLTIRLQGTMKILLYSISKSRLQNHDQIQTTIRNIMRSYSQAGYHTFNAPLFKIAYRSVRLYCFLLKINLYLKGLK